MNCWRVFGSLLVEALRFGVVILSADPERLFPSVGFEGMGTAMGCPEETWLLSTKSGLHFRLVGLWAL